MTRRRWWIAFGALLTLCLALIVTIIVVQIQSGSLERADQIGGTLGPYLAIPALMALGLGPLYSKATHEKPAVTPSPDLSERPASPPRPRRRWIEVLRVVADPKTLGAVAGSAILVVGVLLAIVIYEGSRPGYDDQYYGAVVHMGAGDTLLFEKYKARFGPQKTFKNQTIPTDLVVMGPEKASAGAELWFMAPSAILLPDDRDSCSNAYAREMKQLNGAYVAIPLDSAATVCIETFADSQARVEVRSGPVEFRVSYEVKP